ncbi:MAG: KamA family radical SAM protein [Pseudomonadota bacterium]
MKRADDTASHSSEKAPQQEEEPPPLVTVKYPFAATDYYMSLAKPEKTDPIRLQFCPSGEELKDYPGLSDDPLDEEKDSPVPGLVHRYPDRALMIVTNVCFMNCRHCTRKRLWQEGRYALSEAEIDRMIDYIREHKEIRDVIISGGDPLTLPEAFLESILAKLRAIPNVQIIRLGTRAPVVNPSMITEKLVVMLKRFRPVWLNTQFNHVQEITPDSEQAVNRILEAGIPVNNQSVLLKGVNDTSIAMLLLCQGLLKIGVRPYYLFHCDPVAGVGHFRTSIAKGIDIIGNMRGYTSGLAIPTYVVDAVGGGGKIPLQPKYLLRMDEKEIVLRNYKGEQFTYASGDNLQPEG